MGVRGDCGGGGGGGGGEARGAGADDTKANREYFRLAERCREDFGPECVAFVQMGSFFEALGEHADLMVEHAMVRSFVRGGVRVAGVQVAGHARVVRMLLARGFLVALHEQFEEEEPRGPAPLKSSKTSAPKTVLVRRRTRVYTPSTPPEGEEEWGPGSPAGALPVLLSAFCSDRALGVATLDVPTGRTRVTEILMSARGTGERRGGGPGPRLRLGEVGRGGSALDDSSCGGAECGEAALTACARSEHLIASARPAEALVACPEGCGPGAEEMLKTVEAAARGYGAFVTVRRPSEGSVGLSPAHQEELLLSVFPEAARRSMLGTDDSLGLAGRPECRAALCELLRYVRSASPSGLRGVRSPNEGAAEGVGAEGACMELERDALEQLDAALLLSMSVRPVTPRGRRELEERLAAPLTSAAAIEARLDEAETCNLPARRLDAMAVPDGPPGGPERGRTRGDGVRGALRGSPDPMGVVRRLASGSAGPAAWGALVRGCDASLSARMEFEGGSAPDRVSAAHAAATLEACREVDLEMAARVAASPPTERDHWRSFFKRGVRPEIDELAEALGELEGSLDAFAASLNDAGGAIGEPLVVEAVRDEGASYLIASPARFRKIKSGAKAYYTGAGDRAPLALPEISALESGELEVTGRMAGVCPSELRHQGGRGGSPEGFGAMESCPANGVLHPRLGDLGAALRYVRTSLRRAVQSAHSELCERVSAGASEPAALLSDEAASLDAAAAVAATALRDGLVRPEVLGGELDAEGGGPDAEGGELDAAGLRHPVVVAQDRGETVVGNDVRLSGGRRGFLLYGLNASGKTTLLKAAGVAVLTAQAGWFVAASSARIRPFRALHARLSSADDLARGRSLFQSECMEMRRVLEAAGPWSLVLADEPCSSTESLSAASLLGAFVASLAGSGARMVVTSHFHEVPRLPSVAALAPAVSVKHLHTAFGEGGEIIFDRRLRDGPGSPEYGLSVARAMAMPEAFLRLAEANRRALAERGPGGNPFERFALGGGGAQGEGEKGKRARPAPGGEAGGSDPEARSRRSRYNARAEMATCEECGAAESTESHHMVPRAAARGVPRRPQNKRGNLAALCDACHDRIHAEGAAEAGGTGAAHEGAAVPRRRVLTSAGLRLIDPRALAA